MAITIDTFKEAAKYLENKGYIVGFTTKKDCIECQMSWDENGRFEEPDYDFPTYIYVCGKRYESDEITLSLARKAECIILSWDGGWTFYIGRTCTNATLQDAYENSLEWYVENEREWDAMEATDEQAEQAEQVEQEAAEQEATDEQAEQVEQDAAHHNIYSECTPCYTPIFEYDISHARTIEEQAALIERAEQQDAPAAETLEEESWFCGTLDTPTDADTACQYADVASLTRTAEDSLYQQRAAERAAQRTKKRPIIQFILTLIILIMCTTGMGTITHAFNKTAPALNADATAITGDRDMAKKIEKQTTATPAPAQAPAQAQAQAPEQAQPKAPTLAELLTRALEAQKDAQKAPETPEQATTVKETITLKTALKRALMAPKTGTTECVIYSTLYAAIRIEEVTTPAPEQPKAETPKEAPEEAGEQSKRVWTIQSDVRRVAFMRELRNVARGRAYCEQITALLDAIDATDEDYMWKTAAFIGLPEDLKKAIKDQFESDACTDAERQECRDALDPHSERITLHQAAIETAAEALARTAPEWTPMLFEETPAPATLRQAILELQYCIFPIDSSPRARVFRGLEGIDFKTLSTPQDYISACKAASLRAGEPSTAIPPEARARIMQWRSGSVTCTATAVTSTAARLAAVWGMD